MPLVGIQCARVASVCPVTSSQHRRSVMLLRLSKDKDGVTRSFYGSLSLPSPTSTPTNSSLHRSTMSFFLIEFLLAPHLPAARTVRFMLAGTVTRQMLPLTMISWTAHSRHLIGSMRSYISVGLMRPRSPPSVVTVLHTLHVSVSSFLPFFFPLT